VIFGFVNSLVLGDTSQDCENDYVCYHRVKGAQCADGSPTGYSVVYRKNATKLMILLDGGGACWNYATCKAGSATHLSEYGTEQGPFKSLDSKLTSGWANLDNPGSPIAEGYNIVRVHYCTGDAFTGNRTQDYSLSSSYPMVVRHVGYRNLELILKEVATRFSHPEKLLFYGASAGGIGVTWNLKLLKKIYPTPPTYVINDGGLIFKAPFVNEISLNYVLSRWGAAKNYPIGGTHLLLKPAEILTYNEQSFPGVRYGLISSYRDSIMTMFSSLLLGSSPKSVVSNILESLVQNELKDSKSQKVFLIPGSHHVFFLKDPSQIISDGKRLSEWAQDMLNDRVDWNNVNPGELTEDTGD
jgi:Pectinacetylesterase